MKKMFFMIVLFSFNLFAQERIDSNTFNQKQAGAMKFLAMQMQKCGKITVPGENGLFYTSECIDMQSESIYYISSAFLPDEYSFPISLVLKDLNDCKVFVEKRIMIGRGIEDIYAYKTGCIGDISYNIQKIIDGTY
jgi:hypothetical protein